VIALMIARPAASRANWQSTSMSCIRAPPLRAGGARRRGLRDRRHRCVFHCGGGSFKSQMKKADASGAHAFAVIIGDDEASAGEVTLKPLR
jgi:hypothetical protein